MFTFPKVEKDLFIGAFELRLLVFLEADDYTGFHQVMLNDEQFKSVSDAIILATTYDQSLKSGYENAEVQLSEEVYKLPEADGLNSVNNEYGD